MLRAENLGHLYHAGTPMQRLALAGISLELRAGECVAVVGASGSGKSTLARILAGLLVPSNGRVFLDGDDVTAVALAGVWKRRLGALGRGARTVLMTTPSQWLERKHWTVTRAARPPLTSGSADGRPIMLAFQNPEDQFFTNAVYEEIAIGLTPSPAQASADRDEPPRSLADKLMAAVRNEAPEPRPVGMANPAIRQAVLQAMHLVELEPEVYGERDPFTLSGGEQRRLALAILLARKPRVLILDEPSAGLDVPGRQRLYACIQRVRHEQKTAVVLVSHDLDEVAEVAERVIVLSGGRVAAQGETVEVLQDGEMLRGAGLAPQHLVRLRAALAALGQAPAVDWSRIDAVAHAITTESSGHA